MPYIRFRDALLELTKKPPKNQPQELKKKKGTQYKMADVEKKEIEQPQETFLKIRMTLTSTKVKELEQVCSSIIDNAVNNQLVKKGPVRLPTKVLKITTRKTPNGEGSKTWETYEMRIHKRYIDVVSPASLVKKITQLTVQPGVEIEVTIVA